MTKSDTLRIPKPAKYQKASESRVLDLILSRGFCMQEKIDGRRMIVTRTEGMTACFNKRGEPAAAPAWLIDAIEALPGGPWVFDGELTDTDYYVFDVPSTPANHDVLPSGMLKETQALPFDERQVLIHVLFKNFKHPNVHKLDTWYDPHEKFMQLLHLRRMGAEGVVLRPREASPYFKGQIYKYKFYQSVDAVVTDLAVDGKEAIEVSVFHNNQLVPIGKAKVDLQTQESMRTFQSVVEIRHRGLGSDIEQGGRMIEPVFMRIRDDKPTYSCTSSQLTVRGHPQPDDTSFGTSKAVTDAIGIERDKAIRLIRGERINDEAG